MEMSAIEGETAVKSFHDSPRREIRNLLCVVFSAILGACLLTVSLLYYYNPSGRYLVNHVLLSPSLVETLSYQEIHPKTEKSTLWTFQELEFSYYNSQTKKEEVILISKALYQTFYEKIEQDANVEKVTPAIEEIFSRHPSARLVIRMRGELGESMLFQEVQFSQGGYYRIPLRQKAQATKSWVYFYHPGIYQEAFNLFQIKI